MAGKLRDVGLKPLKQASVATSCPEHRTHKEHLENLLSFFIFSIPVFENFLVIKNFSGHGLFGWSGSLAQSAAIAQPVLGPSTIHRGPRFFFE
jgi:hypothetical protein